MPGLPPPQNLVDIDLSHVQYAFTHNGITENVFISDRFYRTVTVDELKRFLKDDKTNEYKYVAEYWDCDDYSFSLMGGIHNVEWGALPFGIMWAKTPEGSHAVNCFVDNDGILWIVEPQRDDVYALPVSWKVNLVVI